MAKGKNKDAFKKDKLDPAKIEAEYGFGYKFFKSDPELWKLVKDAVAGGWDVNRFQAKLKATDWFQTHSATWRQTTALKYTDPASYQAGLDSVTTKLKNLSGQFGINLDPDDIKRFSSRAYLLGWSDEQILDHIAGDVTPSSTGHYGGDLSGIEDSLRKTALANGVQINPTDLQKWMQSIVRGDTSEGQYEDHIRDIAAKTFGAYGDEIKGGMDAADIAAPYMQSMSQILELNPSSLTMNDRTIRQAMSYRNQKGEAVPMSITDFEDSLRQDKRWQFTQNAKDTMTGYAESLAKLWGLS